MILLIRGRVLLFNKLKLKKKGTNCCIKEVKKCNKNCAVLAGAM